jgi:branched-chain amino acid transport system permease protein
MFEQILITGLTASGIYFLLAVGFALVFGVARIINLAHTAFYMLAAYLIYWCISILGLNIVLALIISIISTTIIGALTYKYLIERIREHEVTVIIITVALALVIQECMLIIFGARYRGIDSYIPGNVEFIGITVPYQYLLALGVALVCTAGIYVLLWKSRIGLAIRVTAQDREIANLMGINVDTICLVTVAIAATLAAVAGAIVAPIRVVEPHMWLAPLVIVMATVVLGGLGSIKGSLVGALILGYTETLVVFLVPKGSFIKEAVAMAIMIAVLTIKPEGLFGAVFEEERL